MLGLLCPPLILVLGFRSREELKTMPQTREEHQEEDPLRSSDSESDTDSDEENMDMRNDHDPEVRAMIQAGWMNTYGLYADHAFSSRIVCSVCTIYLY